MNAEQTEFDFSDDVPTNFAECWPIGVYRDRSFEDYAAIRGINSGTVSHGKVSPFRMKQAFDGKLPNEDTRVRKFGRATHSGVLTPDDFAKNFKVSRPCEAHLKSGERCGQSCGATASYYINGWWLCGRHAPQNAIPERDVVTESELKAIQGIRESLHGHFLNELLRAPGWAEVSIVFPWQSLILKARLDRYCEGPRPFVLDLKTCQSGKGRREDCQKSIAEYGWHRQAAIYVHGIDILTGKRPEFLWLFAEKTEPFDVNLIPASDEDIEIGWAEVEGVLSGFQNCVKDGKFPGYIYSPETIQVGGLPPWFVKQARAGT